MVARPSFDLQVFSTLEENHEEHVAPRFFGVFLGGGNGQQGFLMPDV